MPPAARLRLVSTTPTSRRGRPPLHRRGDSPRRCGPGPVRADSSRCAIATCQTARACPWPVFSTTSPTSSSSAARPFPTASVARWTQPPQRWPPSGAPGARSGRSSPAPRTARRCGSSTSAPRPRLLAGRGEPRGAGQLGRPRRTGDRRGYVGREFSITGSAKEAAHDLQALVVGFGTAAGDAVTQSERAARRLLSVTSGAARPRPGRSPMSSMSRRRPRSPPRSQPHGRAAPTDHAPRTEQTSSRSRSRGRRRPAPSTRATGSRRAKPAAPAEAAPAAVQAPAPGRWPSPPLQRNRARTASRSRTPRPESRRGRRRPGLLAASDKASDKAKAPAKAKGKADKSAGRRKKGQPARPRRDAPRRPADRVGGPSARRQRDGDVSGLVGGVSGEEGGDPLGRPTDDRGPTALQDRALHQ